MKNIIIYFLVFFIINNSFSQLAATSSNGTIVVQQPSIIIIPRVNEGQDIRTILDQNEPLRSAITKVNEFFIAKGFKTFDFVGVLKNALVNRVFTSENQNDMKATILQLANPDIYVEVDIAQISCSGASIARVNMNSYFTSTGFLMGSIVAESPCNQAAYGRLINTAIETNQESFLNTIQSSYDKLLKNGVPISIEISLNTNSIFKMSTPIVQKNGDELSDVIIDWIDKAAFQNQYSPPFVTDLKMIITEVRLPLIDQSTGYNYNSQKFAKSLQDYLKSLGIQNKKDLKTGGIFITIQ